MSARYMGVFVGIAATEGRRADRTATRGIVALMAAVVMVACKSQLQSFGIKVNVKVLLELPLKRTGESRTIYNRDHSGHVDSFKPKLDFRYINAPIPKATKLAFLLSAVGSVMLYFSRVAYKLRGTECYDG